MSNPRMPFDVGDGLPDAGQPTRQQCGEPGVPRVPRDWFEKT